MIDPKFIPEELAQVPFVVADIPNSLEQRMVLWRMGAALAPTDTWAEFGCGSSTERLMGLLPASGTLHCFDSERGLPEPWNRGTDIKPAGSYANSMQVIDRRAVRHRGWYKDTLPGWIPKPLGLIHIDCDIYSSTSEALTACKPYCVNGTVLSFDELYGYPTYADHEYKALIESGLKVRWLARGYYQALGVVEC